MLHKVRCICPVSAARFKLMENATQDSIYSWVQPHLQPINWEAKMILTVHPVPPLAPVTKLELSYLKLRVVYPAVNSRWKFSQPPTEAPPSSSSAHSTCVRNGADAWNWSKKTLLLSLHGVYVPACARVPPHAKHKQATDRKPGNDSCDWMI